MLSHAELIEFCLEIVAQKKDNIAPLVYKRFFAAHPEAEAEFGSDDYNVTKDDMIVLLIMELMNFSSGTVYQGNVKRWIADHESYGVTLPMYKTMLVSLEQAMQEVVGSDWTSAMSGAWQAQFEILEEILTDVYGEKYTETSV